MYFFRSIVLVFIIILASFMIYQFLLDKKRLNIGKKKLLLLFLIIIQGLMILFSDNSFILIFIDFSCLLAYKIKKRKEALLLSLINILHFNVVTIVPIYFYLIYFVYFLIDFLFVNTKKDSINSLLFIKYLATSYVCFLYFNYNSIGIVYLVFSLAYFTLMLKLGYLFLSNCKENELDNNLVFQIAHEVKNPIAVCKGYLDMLDTSKKDKVNKYIPIIKSEMNRALTIMDDFLNLKRLTVNKDIMDLTLLIEDIMITVRTILNNKNITFEVQKLDDEIIIEADYDRLKQVFINLIKNAYEANAKNIKLVWLIKKDEIVIKVIDDGAGISSSDLKKIGQVFYTTKVKGTGIGVSMSKEIIKLHNGSLKYISKLGEGTEAIITLPYQYIF